MGAKKKVEVPQPPPQAPQEKVVHNVYTFRANDGADFKLGEEHIAKHSSRLRSLAEQAKDETVLLEDIDGKALEVIVEYINLHKEKDPVKIPLPLRSNQALRLVMEEGDAELVERVLERGDHFVLRLLELTQWL